MTEQKPVCPMCEQAALQPKTYTGEIEHNAHRLEVHGLEFYCCPECDADPVFPDQARRNHRRFQDARRRADGLLTGKEIAGIRENLGLTQRQAADLFGGGANAFSKYERGDVIQSVAMDRLIRMVQLHPEYVANLKDLFDHASGADQVKSSEPELHSRRHSLQGS